MVYKAGVEDEDYKRSGNSAIGGTCTCAMRLTLLVVQLYRVPLACRSHTWHIHMHQQAYSLK
jgi:hypothetical protein